MDKKKLAIIGLGYMGLHYLKILNKLKEHNELDGFSLDLICDIDSTQLNKVASKYLIFQTTTNPDAIMQDSSIDTVIITTPTKFHYSQAMSAINNGKVVYCEKPLALNSTQTKDLLNAVLRKKVINQTGLVFRHSPLNHYIKKILDEKLLGEPILCNLRLNSCFPDSKSIFRTNFRMNKQESGGGILKEESIHDIDLLTFFFGTLIPEKVILSKFDSSLNIETKLNTEFRVNADLIINYKSEWHNIPRGGLRDLEIVCEHGKITANDYFFSSDLIIEQEGSTKVISKKELTNKYMQDRSFSIEFKHYQQSYGFFALYSFLNSLREGISCSPSFLDAHKVEEKIQEMYEMAEWID